MKLRILIVDDHRLIREGLAWLLRTDKDIEVVGEADNGYTAVEQCKQLHPDIVLMDLYMPTLDGISATRLIKETVPDTCVILLTVSQNEEDLMEAIYSGASGYIYKDTDASTLIEQVKRAYAGDTAFGPDMVKRILAGVRRQKPESANTKLRMGISSREKEVLGLIAGGLTNKAISSSLAISINTTRTHVRALMQKLNSDNRTQLATLALRDGLTSESNVRSQKFGRAVPQQASA